MRTWTRIAWAAFGLAVMACGGSSGTAASLAGTWNATKLEYVSTASVTTKVELVSRGTTSTIVLQGDGTYRTTIRAPGQADEVTTGTWSASADVLTLRETGMPGEMQFNYALSGDTVTLTGADAEWDFDDDGSPEPAKLNVVAVRQ